MVYIAKNIFDSTINLFMLYMKYQIILWGKKNKTKNSSISQYSITDSITSSTAQLFEFLRQSLIFYSEFSDYCVHLCYIHNVLADEEGRRTYWPKHCEYNNKDEDNNLKTLNDKKNSSDLDMCVNSDIFRSQ